MATQIDIIPSTTLGSGNQPNGLHLHSPNGASASQFNNSSDFPSVSAAVATTAKTVSVKIIGTQGCVVRFSSPA